MATDLTFKLRSEINLLDLVGGAWENNFRRRKEALLIDEYLINGSLMGPIFCFFIKNIGIPSFPWTTYLEPNLLP
jgi:hypothetical protein